MKVNKQVVYTISVIVALVLLLKLTVIDSPHLKFKADYAITSFTISKDEQFEIPDNNWINPVKKDTTAICPIMIRE